MAGLLLGPYNILVLDEPGNHLDVETVESLADALLDYKGTVIFTSHDRHFMKRVASSIIEVREGTARNYNGNYEAYLYYVNKEIEDGERATAASKSKSSSTKVSKEPAKATGGKATPSLDDRNVQKQIKNLERKIAQLDARKRELNDQLMQSTDADEALKLHNEMTSVGEELAQAEEQWCALSGF